MSAEGGVRPLAAPLALDPRARHVLRYAFGATLAMAIAAVFAWPVAYLVPVLSLTLLASPAPPPSLRQGAALVGTLILSIVVGLWVIKYLLGSSFSFFVGLGLILFRVFYAQCSGASPILVLWLLLALLLLPFIAVQSPDAALGLARSLVLGVSVSLGVAWIAHGILPETRGRAAEATRPPLAPPRERLVAALERWIVVFPVVVLFHWFEWSSALVTLILIALLSIQPGFASSFRGGIALLTGNAMGGAAAILAFTLLTIVPRLGFLLLLCLLGGLLFGRRLLGGGKLAPLHGMAYSTMLLLLGSSTSSEGDAKTAAYTRIALIMMAVVYVVVAFGLLRRLRAGKAP